MSSNSISRRALLKTAVPAVAATATLAAPPVIANTKIKWRVQSLFTSGISYYDPIHGQLCRNIMEATNNELEIELLQANTVVPTTEILGALRRGLLDGAPLYPGYWIGKIPAAGHLSGHMGTWETHEEMEMFFYQMGALEIIQDAYAQFGIHQVGPLSYGALALYSKKPLETLDDFKGFKVRSTGTPAKVFEKLGAATVFIPGGELYQGLQTGVVDGAHWGGIEAGWGMNLQEVTDYIVTPNLLGHVNGEFMVSQKSWDALGSDHKKVVEQCVRSMSAEGAGYFLHGDYQKMNTFSNEMGKNISHLNEDAIAALRAKSMEVVDEYSAADPKYCGKLGAILHDFMKITGKL